ncbi:MAG TPA: hypothetical protein VEL31_15850 [Ktedonobacteraceae bacterium]|nr:hypothetical protein [Ktedonobacteraceae bacterium]
MPRKDETPSKWLTAQEAAEILTARSGHDVSAAYVRRLGNPNGLAKIEIWQVDRRTRLYSRKDVEAYTVQPRGDGSVRRAVRARKTRPAA